jgi:2-iminobutanoate/2-iminopropanoate deaminase
MKHVALIAGLCFAVAAAAQTDRTFLKSKLAAERQLPFSSGVRVGNTLYVAGTTVDPAKVAAGLSPEQEAGEVMEQVKQAVEQAGMTMDDVVSVQVFCTDLANYDAFNGVYRKYFREDFPARTFVGVAKLLFGARFEVNAVAVSHPKKRPG